VDTTSPAVEVTLDVAPATAAPAGLLPGAPTPPAPPGAPAPPAPTMIVSVSPAGTVTAAGIRAHDPPDPPRPPPPPPLVLPGRAPAPPPVPPPPPDALGAIHTCVTT